MALQRPVKERLRAARAAHPEFCDVELAREAACHSAYVRNRAQEWGWSLPSREHRRAKLPAGQRDYSPAPGHAAASDMEWRMQRLRDAILAAMSEPA